MATTIETLVVKITGDATGLAKTVGQGSASLTRFANKAQAVSVQMGTLGRKMTRAFTVPTIGIAAISSKFFMDFEAGMRNVNTIARQNEEQFRATSQAVLDMAEQLGAQPKGLTQALYNINSASFQAGEGLKVLSAATMAARAGVTETAVAARGITAVLNAYGKTADDSGDVSDILFKTVEKGVLTFEELANTMGTVVATASAAKIPFDQVAGAGATMTRGGINSAMAFTSLNRMIMRLMQGTPQLNKLFKEAGEESGRVMLQTKGLGATMALLAEKTKGDAGALMDMGFRLRDLKAAMSLTRKEGKDFAGDLAEIADKAKRAGATANAFKEQTKTLRFQWDKLKSLLSVTAIELGQTLRPIVVDVIEKIKGWVKWWRNLSTETKENIMRIALWVAVIGPMILIGSKLVAMVAALVKGIVGLGTGIVWLVANPWAAWVAIIGVSIGLIAKLISEMVKLGKAWKEEARIQKDLQDNMAGINAKYGSLAKLRKGNENRAKASMELEKKIGTVLNARISLEAKLAFMTELHGRVAKQVNRNTERDMVAVIARLKEMIKARAEAMKPKPFVQSEEDIKAQKKFQTSLSDAVFDQMTNEQKINKLMEKRRKIQQEMSELQKGSKAFFEAREQALKIETELRGVVEERAVEIRKKAKDEAVQATKFAGAAEAGSVEAYRIKIRGQKRNEIVQINKGMKEKLKELVDLTQDELKILKEASKAEEVTVVKI